MPSFGGILSIARGALTVSQAAVQIASHNIANANTPGYSRQREVLTARDPEVTPFGVFGTGVTMSKVQRQRDALLDQQFRESAGSASAYSTRSEVLQRIENIFGEPSDTGLASSLDKFFNAWSDLATDPTNASARTAVQQTATALTNTFNSLANQIDALKSETVARAQSAVDDINQIATQVAQLNGQITAMESAGSAASDLRDRRDVLLDQLAKTATVRVVETSAGAAQVMLGTVSLVDGVSAKQVAMTSTGTLGFKIADSPDSLNNIGGSLGALQDVYNTDIGGITSKLDTLAASLITDVNAIHRTGWSPTAGAAGNWNPLLGPTGSQVDFFDATAGNDTAARIRLSTTVASSAASIAASGVLNAPGDNSVALGMAGLRESAPSALNTNFAADFRATVSTLAGQLNQTKNSTAVFETLAEQTDQRRTAVFGVSVDEELIQIMRQQQSYAAASKVIRTVDEMMQTLLQLKQ